MTRATYVMVTAVAALAIVIASFVPTSPRLVWNASASVPIGFYTIAPAERIEVPDLVAVMPPEPVASFMVERGYIGRGAPLLKRVIGLPGQLACRGGRSITVDAVTLGEARDRDHEGRDLPVWQGCRIIADGEVFLMNPDVGDSLDGRYFGPLPASVVIGRATPLFTDEDGDGRLNWRTPMR
ncbi:S26 family signal peptidase [Pelagibacterium lentulum]|uniref:Peptidase S26 n=1 Tax=Pelagibacterium lentulum TaxID=2029865 RepID=A0A916R8B8_9HYPH|nr:S26 family signal peptidase [Pelagibacterium lentulum]GGA43651.1 peptidase S26 [Pelagibacterium lentulum]